MSFQSKRAAVHAQALAAGWGEQRFSRVENATKEEVEAAMPEASAAAKDHATHLSIWMHVFMPTHPFLYTNPLYNDYLFLKLNFQNLPGTVKEKEHEEEIQKLHKQYEKEIDRINSRSASGSRHLQEELVESKAHAAFIQRELSDQRDTVVLQRQVIAENFATNLDLRRTVSDQRESIGQLEEDKIALNRRLDRASSTESRQKGMLESLDQSNKALQAHLIEAAATLDGIRQTNAALIEQLELFDGHRVDEQFRSRMQALKVSQEFITRKITAIGDEIERRAKRPSVVESPVQQLPSSNGVIDEPQLDRAQREEAEVALVSPVQLQRQRNMSRMRKLAQYAKFKKETKRLRDEERVEEKGETVKKATCVDNAEAQEIMRPREWSFNSATDQQGTHATGNGNSRSTAQEEEETRILRESGSTTTKDLSIQNSATRREGNVGQESEATRGLRLLGEDKRRREEQDKRDPTRRPSYVGLRRFWENLRSGSRS